MSDAAAPVHRRLREQVAQAGDASRELAGFHPTAVQYRDPGGVVAAVFQSSQALHQKRHRVSRADVSYDSAHRSDALTLEFKQRVAGDSQTEPSELGQRP